MLLAHLAAIAFAQEEFRDVKTSKSRLPKGKIRVTFSDDVEQMVNIVEGEGEWITISDDILDEASEQETQETEKREIETQDQETQQSETQEADTQESVEPKTEEGEPENQETPAPPQFTREHHVLHDKIKRCLDYYRAQTENAASLSPWGIMHAMMAYGPDSEVYADGRKVNAISWLCWNGPCRGMQLMKLSNGRIYAQEGPGLQGHSGQFLAMLAQCRVKSKSPMRVEGKQFTVVDLIRSEMLTCRSGTELTFKLIGLSHYLRSDVRWRSQYGEVWDIPRLIREELAQPVVGSACGGTHRMMSFSYAVRIRSTREEPIDGEWLRAKTYVEDYHEYTLGMQNPDGSFSTNFFESRADSGDIDEKVKTTGHILEWLAFSMTEDQLRDDPRMLAAANCLVDLLLRNYKNDWEIGPKGHAIRALLLYKKRAFGDNYAPQADATVKVAVPTPDDSPE
jgi:hypothetical protein